MKNTGIPDKCTANFIGCTGLKIYACCENPTINLKQPIEETIDLTEIIENKKCTNCGSFLRVEPTYD